MDLGIIIAISGSTAAIAGTVLAMMFWVRSESNGLRSDAHSDRKDMITLARCIESEMKDFHHRLLEIERGRK